MQALIMFGVLSVLAIGAVIYFHFDDKKHNKKGD